MSYILDALKKSEQQRDHGKIPDVQTVHSSSLNYRNDKKAIWPYILIAAVILNLIAIVYFIVDKNSVEVTSVVENTRIKTEADVNTLIHVPASTLNEESSNIESPIKTPEKIRTDEAVQIKPSLPTPVKKITPAVITTQNDTQEGVVEYFDLPASTRLQIPTITVSAHIYSSNPVQRSIVINNKFLEEGDYVLDNLILHEITTDGAIFDFNGTRFRYGVVAGWQ
jgi:general secretion pathway protein B